LRANGLADLRPAWPGCAAERCAELAIARLIAKGLPNKCIGDILEISPWTVATHLRRIFVKLGVTSRAAMVARLGEENLL
jgi:two-component system, NarL family, nitrate/nitrite response regulator NarL